MKIKIFKGLLTLGLAASIAVSGIYLPKSEVIIPAEAADIQVQYSSESKEYATGYVEPELTKEFSIDQVDEEVLNENFPAVYKSDAAPIVRGAEVSMTSKDYVTAVKDQGTDGVCWAFASTSDFESLILKKLDLTNDGYNEANKSYLDLSENHLRHATSDDGGNDLSPYSRGYNDGGNTQVAVAYYTRAVRGLNGPVWESSDPYDSNGSARSLADTMKITDRAGYYLTKYTNWGAINPVAQSNSEFEAYKSAVKDEITRTGAACLSFYSDSALYKTDSSGSYYAYIGNGTPNHEVTVIGWDDNVSSSKFKRSVPGDGAWLCKNSWGTKWGTNGYFYMSYYTPVEADSISGIMPDGISFDTIYEHDRGLMNHDIGYNSKTFVYNKFNAETAGKLSCIGLLLGSKSAYYKFYVSKTGDPKDFNEVKVTILDDSSMSDEKENGYYSADKYGWRMASLTDSNIVVDGEFLIGVEITGENANSHGAFQEISGIGSGKSFVAESLEKAKAGLFFDTGAVNSCVANIKAFTTSKNDPVLTNAGGTLTASFDYNDALTEEKTLENKLTVTVSKNEDGVSVLPSMFSFSSDKEVYTAVSGLSVSEFSGNDLTALQALTLTVTAKNSVSDGEYYLAYKGKVISSAPIAYTKTLEFTDTHITEDGAFSYSGNNPKMTVLLEYGGKEVKTIADQGFKGNTNVVDVTLTDGITEIGSEAFLGCTSLKYLEIPDSVIKIGDDAFKDCDPDHLLIICSDEVAKLLPPGIAHSDTRELVSDKYFLYGGDKAEVDYSTKQISINGVQKGVFTGKNASSLNFKWVLEKADGKAPSDVKLTYKNAKGKTVSASSYTGTLANITTKVLTKMNSFVYLKGVSLNYDRKKNTGTVYTQIELAIQPLSVSGYKDLKSTQTFGFNEKKGVGFEKSSSGDNSYDLTMYEGKSFKLPFTAKDGADKTLLYKLSGSSKGVTVVNGKVTAYNAAEDQTIEVFPLYKTIDCPVITVNVTVITKPNSLKSNASSVTLASGYQQYLTVGTVPPSNSSGTYKFEYNMSKFSVVYGTSELDGSGGTAYNINGGMLLYLSVNDGAAINTKQKEYLKITRSGVTKPLSIELKPAILMVNVKSLKENYKKVGKDGCVEINIPRGGAVNLGVAVNPVNADNRYTWRIGNELDSSGEIITDSSLQNTGIDIKGCIVNGRVSGTYYIQADTVANTVNGENLKTKIYKINVYEPSGSLFIQDPEITDITVTNKTSELKLESCDDYMIKGGILMRTENALSDCDKYFTVGDDIQIDLPMSANGCTEPIEWKSNKQTGLRVSADSEDGSSGVLSVRALQAGSYTVTGTTKNTKQKISFKVLVKKPDGMTDAALRSEEDANSFEKYSSGSWTAASSLTVKAGEELPITLSDGVSGKLTLKVKDSAFASVNTSTGIIKGKKAGTTAVTATVTYGKAGSNTFTIPLTVTAADPIYKKVTVPVYAKKGASFKISATGKNIDSKRMVWYYCKKNSTGYDAPQKLADAGAKTASISAAGIYKVYPIMSDGTGSGESLAKTIGIYNNLVTKANMNAAKGAKEKLKELKKGVAAGSVIYLPVFTNEGADAGDIMWSSSNTYLANAEECSISDVDNSEFAEENKDAYGWVKITASTEFIGKVTLTGVLRNSGKKVSVSFNVRSA